MVVWMAYLKNIWGFGLRFCPPSARIIFKLTQLFEVVGTKIQTALNSNLKLVQTIKNVVQTVAFFSQFTCRGGFKVFQTVQSVVCHRVFNITYHINFFVSEILISTEGVILMLQSYDTYKLRVVSFLTVSFSPN